MSEENKDLVCRYVTIWNQGSSANLDEVLAENFIDRDITYPKDSDVNLGEFKQLFDGVHGALTHAQITIDDMVAEGDKVALRYTLNGIHDKGPFMGVSPLPKPLEITMTGLALFRIAGGKIIESWVHSDDLGVKQQLGLIE